METSVKTECQVLSLALLGILIVIFIMWLLEPVVFRLLKKYESKDPTWKNVFNAETLIFLYKYIGLGLIFIVGYGLWTLA
jgi:hypothetical protein